MVNDYRRTLQSLWTRSYFVSTAKNVANENMLKIKKQGDETYVTDPNSESEIDSNKRTKSFIGRM
jgi:hypothetical protein